MTTWEGVVSQFHGGKVTTSKIQLKLVLSRKLVIATLKVYSGLYLEDLTMLQQLQGTETQAILHWEPGVKSSDLSIRPPSCVCTHILDDSVPT